MIYIDLDEFHPLFVYSNCRVIRRLHTATETFTRCSCHSGRSVPKVPTYLPACLPSTFYLFGSRFHFSWPFSAGERLWALGRARARGGRAGRAVRNKEDREET